MTKLGVPKVIKMDYRCWHGKWGFKDDRCPEYGNWGWTKEAADKAGASPASILRLARWCIKHKHFDDVKLEEPCEKTYPGSPTAPADQPSGGSLEPSPE